jgi:hypothetical protein
MAEFGIDETAFWDTGRVDVLKYVKDVPLFSCQRPITVTKGGDNGSY